ncbi:hypothetical protein Tco_0641736 [Tanacetum coccineum]
MIDIGETDVILGIKIKRENKGIIITQSRYIEKILKKFNREDCSQVSTPIPMDSVEMLMSNTRKPVDQLEYSRAIGCLMYAMTSTRPDIAYTVGRLSRFTSNPSRQHWHAITRVFKYLKGTMIYGVSYVGYPLVLEAYSNASWINHVEDSSSTSGWVFLLGGGADIARITRAEPNTRQKRTRERKKYTRAGCLLAKSHGALDLGSTRKSIDKETTMAGPNDYITATRKNFISNDNEGRMVEKCIVEIQGTFLVKIRDDAFNGNVGENAFRHIDRFLEIVGPIKINGLTQDRFRLSVFHVSLVGAASEWFTKECLGSITTWDNMVEKFILKFHHLSDHDEEKETDDDNPNKTNNVPEIFKIEGNLFDFETPLCMAFYEFNHLLKIDADMFAYDVPNLKTYDEYEQELKNVIRTR